MRFRLLVQKQRIVFGQLLIMKAERTMHFLDLDPNILYSRKWHHTSQMVQPIRMRLQLGSSRPLLVVVAD